MSLELIFEGYKSLCQFPCLVLDCTVLTRACGECCGVGWSFEGCAFAVQLTVLMPNGEMMSFSPF